MFHPFFKVYFYIISPSIVWLKGYRCHIRKLNLFKKQKLTTVKQTQHINFKFNGVVPLGNIWHRNLSNILLYIHPKYSFPSSLLYSFKIICILYNIFINFHHFYKAIFMYITSVQYLIIFLSKNKVTCNFF